MLIFYRYNRDAILELLRVTSVEQFQHQLCTSVTDVTQRRTLEKILDAWNWRALGPLPLRDALMVDPQRGALFYGQLCYALALEQQLIAPAELGEQLAIAPELVSATMERLVQTAVQGPLNIAQVWPELEQAFSTNRVPLAGLVARSAQPSMALGVKRPGSLGLLALPDELLDLLPPPPAAFTEQSLIAPTGPRRLLAMALIGVGALWLFGQLLFWEGGSIRPAGGPLALFTIALLVGVRAGLPGYLGSACIWLVANLPGFHYDIVPSWTTLTLLITGLLLLACDHRIRAMWRWMLLHLRSHRSP